MSVFICNSEHIGVLANAMSREGVFVGRERQSPQQMAALLAKANWESVDARYSGDAEFMSGRGWDQYVRECQEESCKPDLDLKPIDFIKMAQCFAYQSCEIDKFNEADYFSDFIGRYHVNEFISAMISKMPGYNEAQWEYVRKSDAPEVYDIMAMVS